MGPGGKGLLCALARLTKADKNSVVKILWNKLGHQALTARGPIRVTPTGALSMVGVEGKKGQAEAVRVL